MTLPTNPGPRAGRWCRLVDGDEEMELVFLGPHFGNVDMEEADRVSLELLPRRLVPLDIWQLADAMTLEATMQRGSCQMRDGRLQRIEAIIERQERMPPEGDNDRLVPDRKNRGPRLFRAGRMIGDQTPLLPLGDGLLVDPISLGECSQALTTMLYRSTNCLRRCGAAV